MSDNTSRDSLSDDNASFVSFKDDQHDRLQLTADTPPLNEVAVVGVQLPAKLHLPQKLPVDVVGPRKANSASTLVTQNNHDYVWPEKHAENQHEQDVAPNTATEEFFSSAEVYDYKHHVHPHTGNEFEARKEHNAIPPFRSIQKRRLKRILLIGCLLFVLALVIVIIFFLLVIIPAGIKSAFWGGVEGNNVFDVLQLSDWHLNPSKSLIESEDIHGIPTSGSWNFTAVTTYSNIFTPLNFLLRLYGTSSWQAHIPPSFVQDKFPNPSETSTYSFLGACVPMDMLVTGGYFIVNSTDIVLSAFNNQIDNMAPKYRNVSWPGGKALITGLINTFVTGDPKQTPLVLLRSTSNFRFGSLYVKGLTVEKPFEFGKGLAKAGFTLPHLTKSFKGMDMITTAAASSPGLLSSFNITSFTIVSLSPPNITVGLDLFLPDPLHYGISFQDVYLSAGLGSKPLIDAVIKKAAIPFNQSRVSLELEVALGFNLTDMGKIVSSFKPETELFIRNVHMKPGPSTPPIQFVNDFLSALDLTLPLSLFGVSAASQEPSTGTQSLLGGILSNLALQLDYAGISGFIDNPAHGYIGAIDLALNATLSQLTLPLPANLQPIAITTPLIISLEASSSYGKSADGKGQDDGDWISFMELVLEGPLELRDGTIVIASQSAGQIRFPSFPFPTQSTSKVPLASAVIKGLSECLSTAAASAIPLLRLSTNVGAGLGSVVQIPPIPLSFEVDTGNLIVSKSWTLPNFLAAQNGGGNSSTTVTSTSKTASPTTFTLPTGSATTTPPAPNPFTNLSLTVTDIVVLSTVNDLATANINLNLPSNPIELVLSNLQAELSIIDTPAVYIKINKVHSMPGTPTITSRGDILAPWAIGNVTPTQAISRLVNLFEVPFNQWVVRFGKFSLQDAQGVSHGWVDDFLGAVELSVSWSVVYNDALKPLVQGLLSRLTGGALVAPR